MTRLLGGLAAGATASGITWAVTHQPHPTWIAGLVLA